ncbi:ArsR/SmtB family transcription factor [Ekhidna sp.]
METSKDFAKITSLIAEPARATILWCLLDGRAYTATELALFANLSPQAGSNHLNKLREHGLISTEKQGRHKYYRISNSEVAYAIEAIAAIIPKRESRESGKEKLPTSGIKHARTCYDHLAGYMGVKIHEKLIARKLLSEDDSQYLPTSEGENWFASLGIDCQKLSKTKRKFAYKCLDWSERKHHLGGALGAALLEAMIERDWIRKIEHSREVVITFSGSKNLHEVLF